MPFSIAPKRAPLTRRESAPDTGPGTAADVGAKTLATLAMLMAMGYREVWCKNDEVNPSVLVEAFALGWSITDAKDNRIKFSRPAAETPLPQPAAAKAPELPPPGPPPAAPLPPRPTVQTDAAAARPPRLDLSRPPPRSPNPARPTMLPAGAFRPNSDPWAHRPRVPSPLSSPCFTFYNAPPEPAPRPRMARFGSAQSGLTGRRTQESATPVFVVTRPETPLQPAQGYFDFGEGSPDGSDEEGRASQALSDALGEFSLGEAVSSVNEPGSARARSLKFTVSRSSSGSSNSSGDSSDGGSTRGRPRRRGGFKSSNEPSSRRRYQMARRASEDSFEFDPIEEEPEEESNELSPPAFARRKSGPDPEVPLDDNALQRRHAELAQRTGA